MREFLIIITLIMISCGRKTTDVHFYESGDILAVYSIENDVKHGPYKVLFENGDIKQNGNYANGLKDGIFKTFFENGDLSEYFFYKNDTLLYLIRFDEDRNVIGSALGVKISKESRIKKKYAKGDTIHFGYTLMHSMVTNPIIGLDVVRFTENGPDTIESLFKLSKNIEYDLIKYKVGENHYALTVWEIDPLDTTFLGWSIEDISFEILP